MFVMILLGFFFLQFRPVQTWVSARAAKYLSQQLDTEITLGSVYFKLFSSLEIRDIMILDLQKDTLLYADRLYADLELSQLVKGNVTLEKIEVRNGNFFLKKLPDSSSNLDFIIAYFSDPDRPKRKDNKRFNVAINEVDLNGVSFQYRNFLTKEHSEGIDFSDIRIDRLYANFSGIDFKTHLLQVDINNLSFHEKSGFQVQQLRTRAVIDSTQMVFSDLLLESNRSKLANYLKLTYENFSDFSDFINRVHIEADFANTSVDSYDIAYFAPTIKRTRFSFGISGNVEGTIADFYGKQVMIQTGKATYLKGDIKVSGLPEIDNTLFDLNLSQLSTNKADLDYLIPALGAEATAPLPAEFSSLGHVNYTGMLMGNYNDFKARGALKSALGKVELDIALDLKTENKYAGRLSTSSFDLGKLLSNPSMGLVSLDATVDGQGFTLGDLHTYVDADIGAFVFKGYSYRNITVDGFIDQQKFDGLLQVDDENLMANLKGEIDFNEVLPNYSFNLDLNYAHLKNLKLYSDTLTLRGQVYSNFKGDDLNNIEGDILLKGLRIDLIDTVTTIDSILLVAEGLKEKRALSIRSDVLDASVRGDFNLSSFGNYFKSIAQHYIPSWKEPLEHFDEQLFEFTLLLKDATPIMKILAPNIRIPDTAFLRGKFSTRDSMANVNGFIPLLEIGEMRITNIILDETALSRSLNLMITADRWDITDSLYIRNINIANILTDDSLRFNVKLSDVDAKNQLDLNGLIAFKENESAKLSLLPSNIVINRINWELDEQVNFDFKQEQIEISGFELKNEDQRILIDGLISGREEDEIEAKFQNFSLETFAGLTNPLGIELKGVLNGDLKVFSILKNPYISTNLNAKDIYYNETEIGDLDLLADMDPETELVNMDLSIKRRDTETLKIIGTYNALQSTDNLNLAIHLEESELIIFEPFLRQLVSDLSGRVTADINVRGALADPVISGTCKLNNASFTVIYLQTRYRVDQEVSVENSVIKLENLALLDENEHRATANGTVDMRSPSDPTMDVVVKAANFMVLNTTSKDNALYYGKAYGSGTFQFKGPTSDMDIDITATTEDGTIFNIPLNASGTVSDNDFITFIAKDSTITSTKSSYFDGLTMRLNLAVTRNAQVNIFTDLGQLTGTGEGNISMNITSLGDFEMFGDYSIAQGKFDFTARDFINKIFEISRGGTIRWTGNPAEASINLIAVYEVRTSVRPLYVAAGRAGTDQRVQAQAEMHLSGSLLHPEIGFSIDFPIDSYVKDELQNYFSDANNVNQQALSLIVRRSFAPGTGTDLTAELNSTVFSAGTELAFNQLNNIVSQSLNLNFVDFNIRSFNEASASIRLLNNRLFLTGGLTDRRGELNDLNVFSNQIASDVEALYLLRRNGNLLLRASNRLNNRNFLNPNDEYVSAIGLVHRQEFDTFNEFFRRMFLITRKKKEEDGETETIPSINTSPVGIPMEPSVTKPVTNGSKN